jgi:predicted MPP superfamily phosphohydrolase
MKAQMRRFLTIVTVTITYTMCKAVQLMPEWPRLAVGLTVLLFFVMLMGMFVFRSKPEVYDKPWFRLLTWTGSLAMGLWATFIIISLPFDILRLMLYLIELTTGYNAILPGTFTTIYFWLALAAMALAGSGFFQAIRGPIVLRVTIPIDSLPAELEGFKIAQISDLHIGATIRESYVKEVVARTNAIDADIVVLTGDIADGHAEAIAKPLALLAGIRAKHGRFYVPGNHEYYWKGGAELFDKIAALGFATLFNANEILNFGARKIAIAGVTDPAGEYMLEGHAPDIKKATKGIENADVKILLAHRPGVAAEADGWRFNLQFSGHTHSGQFFPFSLFIGLAHKYSRGVYRHGRLWVYVNPGTGYWGPANRLGVTPEISLITLSANPKQESLKNQVNSYWGTIFRS